MLPDRSIAADLLAKMTPCRAAVCIEMDAQLALVRLKSQVDPVIPLQARLAPGSDPVTVRVKARISESGDVTVSEASGGNLIFNDAVKTAVQLWKFHPTIIRNENRCVITEIPVVLNFEEKR